ncbi:MAG: tetratricopeptide (TPR) repeat protein, partial [Gammaproteobacteria bacterium]
AAQAGAAQDTVDLDGQSSGLSVRMAIARGSLKLWSAAGTGVGQYQAAFPPFREVEETERSRDGICQGGVREVEHPHNDWLLGLVELGLLGGLAWIALLLFGAYRAGLALLRGTSQDAAIGAGLIAVLANAFAHGPLLISPASSVLGFLLLGAAITTRPQAQRDPTLIAALGPASLVIACIAALQAPNAWALWQHGRSLGSAAAALGDIQNAEAEIPRDELEPLLLQLEQSLDAALESVSGSALALRMTARFSPAVLGNTELRAPLWEALLMQQPNSFEALYELGLEQTRLINDSAARAAWEQALALQPTHPVLLRNIARLAFHGGDEETGDALLTQVQFQGCLEAGWIARLGEELCLLGRIPAGRSLLTREEPRLVDAGWYDALSQEARQGDLQRRSDALALVANLLWAREHAEAARWSDAVRLYRQALNRSRRYVEGGGACLRLEFAAAALIAGQDDVASAQLNGLTPTPLDLRDLPQWALDQLKENGVINATND